MRYHSTCQSTSNNTVFVCCPLGLTVTVYTPEQFRYFKVTDEISLRAKDNGNKIGWSNRKWKWTLALPRQFDREKQSQKWTLTLQKAKAKGKKSWRKLIVDHFQGTFVRWGQGHRDQKQGLGIQAKVQNDRISYALTIFAHPSLDFNLMTCHVLAHSEQPFRRESKSRFLSLTNSTGKVTTQQDVYNKFWGRVKKQQS